MNQHYDHSSEDNLDELEKQLASVSLVAPTDSYHRIPESFKTGGDSPTAAENRFWPWFAIPVLCGVFAFGLYSFFQSKDSILATENRIADSDRSSSSTNAPDEAALMASAPESPFQEGTHYFELANPLDMSDSAATEVVAFFWYPCWPCNEFEELLTDWAANLPAGVTLIRVPTIWSEEMRFPAQAYYTAQLLGVLDRAHRQFYLEFEKNEPTITGEIELQLFFAGLGISAARFNEVFHSAEVQNLVDSAVQSNRNYEVQATPTLFVHGQYRISSAPGGHAEMLEVANYLIDTVQDAAAQ